MGLERKISRITGLDMAQQKYLNWRTDTYIKQSEDRFFLTKRFMTEVEELREEIFKPKRSRMDEASEWADVFIFSMGILDTQDLQMSSLFSNGATVKTFDQLQQQAKQKIKKEGRRDTKEIFHDMINNAQQLVSAVGSNEKEKVLHNLRQVIGDTVLAFETLGFPMSAIISGKLARNEDKYPREYFSQEAREKDVLSLGLAGQTLEEQVKLIQDECRRRWLKTRDQEYLIAALTSAEKLYLTAFSFISPLTAMELSMD